MERIQMMIPTTTFMVITDLVSCLQMHRGQNRSLSSLDEPLSRPRTGTTTCSQSQSGADTVELM